MATRRQLSMFGRPSVVSYESTKRKQIPDSCEKCHKYDRHVPLYYKCTMCRKWLCLPCTYEGFYIVICLNHKVEVFESRNFKKHYMEHYLVCSQTCSEKYQDMAYLRYCVLLEKKHKLKKRCDFLVNYLATYSQAT